MAELEDVQTQLLGAMEQLLRTRPGGSKTIMELALAYEALARSSGSPSGSD